MKLSLLTLLLVAAVVCISVTDSAPQRWQRFRLRRLRNRTEEKVEAAPEGKKEEKAEAKAEAAPEEANKKEEKTEPAGDFGTLAAAADDPGKGKEEAAKPDKKGAKAEAEEAEEAEGLSAEV